MGWKGKKLFHFFSLASIEAEQISLKDCLTLLLLFWVDSVKYRTIFRNNSIKILAIITFVVEFIQKLNIFVHLQREKRFDL